MYLKAKECWIYDNQAKKNGDISFQTAFTYCYMLLFKCFVIHLLDSLSQSDSTTCVQRSTQEYSTNSSFNNSTDFNNIQSFLNSGIQRENCIHFFQKKLPGKYFMENDTAFLRNFRIQYITLIVWHKKNISYSIKHRLKINHHCLFIKIHASS